MGFLCLLVQIMAILIEPLAKRKLSVILPSTLWGFPFAPATLSALKRGQEKVLLSRCLPPRHPRLKGRWSICNTVSTLNLFKLHSIYCTYIVSQLGWELGVQEGGFTQYSSRLASAPPNSRLYPCSQAREIRSLESLKLIFMLNYRFQVPDTRPSLITLLTLMPLGRAGTNALRSLLTHYVHEGLTQKKVGDGFVATLGRDAERTPSAISNFFFFSCLSVINQFANWEAEFPCSLLFRSPLKQRLRTRQGGCKVQVLPVEREAALGPSAGVLGSQPCGSSHPGPPGAQPTARCKKEAF